ncbi:hypothetical protein PCANC_08226 [Puccinia coronata f. sp. avenae]|uniref:Retrovirus-related Pol polyprotein from transposon TNT 1-94-like beta-barrel domain-containing protein n=1 Tax=Puccinia coronata f. sp. avenae TaxID=200324 RepID=A0A2N5T5P7_9BASI|nr:hypothetical protein PCASD_18145 [Puccinia coronata f. sp. avenae]PLW20821.1 hypothetical protein PCANC_08226 [Puccinia coronata f. sp. avenae]
MLKRRAQAKAKKASVAHEGQAADSGIVWHTVKKAHLAKLPANTVYLDSGASHHMIADRRFFATYSTESTCKIKLANGQMTVSPGSGYVYVKTETGEHLKLKCLHVPGLVGNLISQGQLYRQGKSIPLVKLSSMSNPDIKTLHRRAGHPSDKSLRKIYNLLDFQLACEACLLSKSHCLPFTGTLPTSTHTAGINRLNTAAQAVLKQPCSTGGRTDTVQPKQEPTGRTDLSDRSRLVLCNRSQELIGQACPTRRQVLRSDSACLTPGRTRLFEHRSNCRVRPVNAGSVIV